mmetsp:Transcript_46275/g.73100  ORF Transcript_46275/g.73100 Transcript_46275/m.73100 type:complete len:242 (-) Transcript_46275:58-783(-)
MFCKRQPPPSYLAHERVTSPIFPPIHVQALSPAEHPRRLSTPYPTPPFASAAPQVLPTLRSLHQLSEPPDSHDSQFPFPTATGNSRGLPNLQTGVALLHPTRTVTLRCAGADLHANLLLRTYCSTTNPSSYCFCRHLPCHSRHSNARPRFLCSSKLARDQVFLRASRRHCQSYVHRVQLPELVGYCQARGAQMNQMSRGLAPVSWSHQENPRMVQRLHSHPVDHRWKAGWTCCSRYAIQVV